MNARGFFSRSKHNRWAFGWLIGWLTVSAACWLALGGKSGSSSLPQASATGSLDSRTSDCHGSQQIRGVARDLVVNRKPIEEIRVGERVWTHEHATTSQPTCVDPKTWRLLGLRSEVLWQDGTLDDINIETLQPPEWLGKYKAAVGASVPIPLDLVEMGLPEQTRAVVLTDVACPAIGRGSGCVVLTTVNHLNADVRELTLVNEAGREQVLKPTGFHKFFLEPDEKWVSACDLGVGDQLRAKDGRLRVIGNKAVPGVHRVYNMTIETEHVYYVSRLGVLTHNPGCGKPANGPNWQGFKPPQPIQLGVGKPALPKPTIAQNHPIPIAMGGLPGNGQTLYAMKPQIHTGANTGWHPVLNQAMIANGFPPLYGPNGSAAAWTAFYNSKPNPAAAQQQAFQILLQTATQFDAAHETSLHQAISANIQAGNYNCP